MAVTLTIPVINTASPAQTAVWAGDNPSNFAYGSPENVVTKTGPTSWRSTFLTGTHTGGKHYVEFELNNIGSSLVEAGISSTGNTGNFLGATTTDWAANSASSAPCTGGGRRFHNSISSSYGDSWCSGSPLPTVMLGVDLDNAELYWGVNGVWQVGSDPVTRTNPMYTGIDTTGIHAGISGFGSGAQFTVQPTFKYTVPSGYSAW